MLGYIIGGILLGCILVSVVVNGVTPEDNERTKRAGRIGLWAFAPPLGFWRSWAHGREKRDEKLAKRIAAEIDKRSRG